VNSTAVSISGAGARIGANRRAITVVLVAAVFAAGLSVVGTGVAWGAGATAMCFQEKEGGAIKQPKHGACTNGYRLTEVGGTGFGAEEEAVLKRVLPHITYVASGVGGKPTVEFSGVNLQVVNGEGTTQSTNGEGNLVIGYDENPTGRKQTGSHNLIVGPYHQYTSFGGIVSGAYNAIEGEYASVVGGYNNDADGPRAVVSGGEGNVAYGFSAAVSGGSFNSAGGKWSSVSGGEEDRATGEASSMAGGFHSYAVGTYSSVGGGDDDWAEGTETIVDGGYNNTALGERSAIFGGKELKTASTFEAKL
jgi:hypothetical protein